MENNSTLKNDAAKSYKGMFNVRLSAELHQKAATFASWQGISLNDFVRKALLFALENQKELIKK